MADTGAGNQTGGEWAEVGAKEVLTRYVEKRVKGGQEVGDLSAPEQLIPVDRVELVIDEDPDVEAGTNFRTWCILFVKNAVRIDGVSDEQVVGGVQYCEHTAADGTVTTTVGLVEESEAFAPDPRSEQMVLGVIAQLERYEASGQLVWRSE